MARYLVTDPATGEVTVRSSLGEAPPWTGGKPEDDSQTALLWVLEARST